MDNKHKELLNEFNEEHEVIIPQLIKEKVDLKNKLKENITIEESLEIHDRLKEIKQRIIVIKRNKRNYLLDNSHLVFDYFENKKKIAEGTNKTTILDTFFNI